MKTIDKDTVISVKNLNKRYRIGLEETKQETFAMQIWHMLTAPFRNFKNLKSLSNFTGTEDESIFWALRDINFEVKKGEVLGIIGHNGAGKSTLLKILSRITEPTEGEIQIKGRVSSLLEVGTGFHPDLTGRENVYMNGTILGMSKKEIDSKFKEIHEFSGIGKYIDTPVKRYSSGMKVRLAFSVAAHLDPEILIIDEVLAVGDAEFQKKCLGKMEDVAGKGRTVLFVSHNMAAVQNLCTRAILLNKGLLVENGETHLIIDNYLNSFKQNAIANINSNKKTSKVFIKDISLNSREKFNNVKSGDDVDLIINIAKGDNYSEKDELSIAIHFYDSQGKRLFVCSPSFYNKSLGCLSNVDIIKCKIENFPLAEGNYSINIWYSVNNEPYPEIDNALSFSVYPGDFYKSGRLPKKDKGSLFLVKQNWTI